MGAWPEGTYSGIGKSYGGDGSTWAKVSDWKASLDNVAYNWCSCSKFNSGQLWNISVAMVLVIEKCNSLQAEIDAMGTPEITWRTIVEAWAKDDFEGAGATIAFIDRMRQLIWDEPFYVKWAARPEQQDL